ncbi:MAG: MFS transporter [Gammaproteobacteria bacterium]|jgi:ACS family hexuronate transporter-like MFS transporter|nr:MFS transporter [Gammaproteobacteria bacterium]MDP6616664.1 MFS transporter [Gammaproteobacteria bacterium]MDP6694994.1 MFS transporter [Gammaproteobacteria bacterium]
MNDTSQPFIAYRWRIAILLCLITTINYIDRQALTVAAPLLMDEFSITASEYGLITSGFLFAYGLGQLLCGPLIDRLGTKRSFALAVIAWSIAGMLHALGRGFVSFFVYRVMLGLTEAANFPAATKAIAEWFPRSERSLAVGIFTMGPGLGAILAPPMIAVIILYLGWQAAFLIPGVIGFIWLILWQRWFYLPHDHPDLPDAERQLIEAGKDPEEPEVERPWYWALRYREVWGLMISRFVSDGAFYFFVFWLPLYLSQERGFDLKAIALFAWIPFLAVDIGGITGGYVGKILIDKGITLDRARKLVIWIGALLVLAAMPAATTESAGTALALIAVAMFAIQFKASSMFTLPADLFPACDVGTIWGMYGAVGSFGGMAFSALAGWTIDHYSWAPLFAAVALMHIVSALLVNLFVPRIRMLRPAV